jgi:Methylamine utilisation protein MauE
MGTLMGRCLRILLGIMWLAVSTLKAASISEFLRSLDTLKLFQSQEALVLVASSVVVAEATVGICLLLTRFQAAANDASLVLCFLFLAVNVYRLLNNITQSCSCLGPLFRLTPLNAILLDGLFLILTLLTRTTFTHVESTSSRSTRTV